VLIGRVVEAAAIEVTQERELEAARTKAAEFAAIRAAEIAETQRLEAEVQRRYGWHSMQLSRSIHYFSIRVSCAGMLKRPGELNKKGLVWHVKLK
jgi:hypothetical protein